MNLRKRSILAALLGFLFTGCSTSYHQRGFLGDGYTDYRISQDKFTVIFKGNTYTESEDVRRFAMMRAAELTVQYGFHYFKIISERDISREAIRTSTTESIKKEEKVHSPGITLLIHCFEEDPNGDVIDADEFLLYNSIQKS